MTYATEEKVKYMPIKTSTYRKYDKKNKNTMRKGCESRKTRISYTFIFHTMIHDNLLILHGWMVKIRKYNKFLPVSWKTTNWTWMAYTQIHRTYTKIYRTYTQRILYTHYTYSHHRYITFKKMRYKASGKIFVCKFKVFRCHVMIFYWKIVDISTAYLLLFCRKKNNPITLIMITITMLNMFSYSFTQE